MFAPDLRGLSGHDFVVTGATGYIGRHLVECLSAEGANVYILGRKNLSQDSYISAQKQIAASSKVQVIEHDGSIEGIANGLMILKDPVIIHLAGLFVSWHNSEHIEPLIDSNIRFTVYILEAMRKASCHYIVNVGTAWENGKDGEYSPVNLYASMKYAAQRILDYYIDAEGYKAVTLKLLDTYGRDDTRRKLLPLLRQHTIDDKPLALSKGFQKINLTYIDDVISALLSAAKLAVSKSEKSHDTYFLLNDDAPTIRELVSLINEVTGLRVPVNWGEHEGHPRQPSDAWLNSPRLPDWRPQVSLEEGIKLYFEGAKNA